MVVARAVERDSGVGSLATDRVPENSVVEALESCFGEQSAITGSRDEAKAQHYSTLANFFASSERTLTAAESLVNDGAEQI